MVERQTSRSGTDWVRTACCPTRRRKAHYRRDNPVRSAQDPVSSQQRAPEYPCWDLRRSGSPGQTGGLSAAPESLDTTGSHRAHLLRSQEAIQRSPGAVATGRARGLYGRARSPYSYPTTGLKIREARCLDLLQLAVDDADQPGQAGRRRLPAHFRPLQGNHQPPPEAWDLRLSGLRPWALPGLLEVVQADKCRP
jgi:hypothetical protein